MRIIRNYDVASYYPHLMTVNGYISRNIPRPELYAEMLERRIKAKKAGDKSTANALKLVANTTYGGMLSPFNDLYDPLMARSVCISGQLYLYELANHLYSDIEGLRIIQLNTDGIMIEFEDTQYAAVQDIVNEWQERTGFELEEDAVKKIVQKDVNGYIEVQNDGTVKVKGGYLTRGIAPAGAFNVNNNMVIVSRAIIDYFVHGTPARQTIEASTDIFDFQIIAKASGKYDYVFQVIGEDRVTVQKCNRVYASREIQNGTLYKVHKETGSAEKIAGLPEHCLIDNANTHTIDEIDREWYIAQAEQHIAEFIGETTQESPKENKKRKRKTQMAEKEKTQPEKKMNVYEKLLAVRQKFAETGLQRTGTNPHAEFKYFTLADIIPVARPILNEYKTLFAVVSCGDSALGEFIDTEDPENIIHFTFNGRQIAEPAKFRMNETQARGAEITYQRRYLYAMMLDLCDEDEIENATPKVIGEQSEQKKETKTKKPATTEERKEAKEKLTSSEYADDLMLKSLKNSLTKLLTTDATKKEFVKGVQDKTENFTKIKRQDCEELIKSVNALLEQHEEGAKG